MCSKPRRSRVSFRNGTTGSAHRRFRAVLALAAGFAAFDLALASDAERADLAGAVGLALFPAFPALAARGAGPLDATAVFAGLLLAAGRTDAGRAAGAGFSRSAGLRSATGFGAFGER